MAKRGPKRDPHFGPPGGGSSGGGAGSRPWVAKMTHFGPPNNSFSRYFWPLGPPGGLWPQGPLGGPLGAIYGGNRPIYRGNSLYSLGRGPGRAPGAPGGPLFWVIFGSILGPPILTPPLRKRGFRAKMAQKGVPKWTPKMAQNGPLGPARGPGPHT